MPVRASPVPSVVRGSFVVKFWDTCEVPEFVFRLRRRLSLAQRELALSLAQREPAHTKALRSNPAGQPLKKTFFPFLATTVKNMPNLFCDGVVSTTVPSSPKVCKLRCRRRPRRRRARSAHRRPHRRRPRPHLSRRRPRKLSRSASASCRRQPPVGVRSSAPTSSAPSSRAERARSESTFANGERLTAPPLHASMSRVPVPPTPSPAP